MSDEARPYTGAAWGVRPPETEEVSARDHRKGGKPDAARKLQIEERRAQVALLILSHVPYRAIGQMLGISSGTVAEDVRIIRRQWRERAADSYEAHVAEEIAKLDVLERAWVAKATPLHPLRSAEDVAAAEAATRVLDRVMRHRARLLGLMQPTRHEVAGIGGGPIEVKASLEAKKARALELVREVSGVAEVQRRAIEAASEFADAEIVEDVDEEAS
jgi:hypothetical protein